MAHPDPDLLATLARQLAAEDDVDAVLRRTVQTSLTQIEGAERAGITMTTRGSVSTPVASDELVCVLDKHQYSTGEGPCLSAAFEHEPVIRVDDLSTDRRWVEFSTAVAHLGVRSMLSFQLYTTDAGAHATTLGALNIYAEAPYAFTDDAVHIGTLLAAHAAVAATAAAEQANLRIALQSRDVIGQAKGVLMERFKLTPEQAFDLLIAASQHTNQKLREVAEHLTTTGQLPTE
ncbi:ANTAR domain-containing protein [Allosaccharopolyspora coralli]|uniref:ANTAR domain-containing protein n=1 Tax=Allosaccharopolyspora coralli TaxID=2665642 RepID=A0A5Q3Q1E8_9PSEU|nr:GAF and ANTAR domain-containing protein [Allosaccharopolyspora coralli]QGK68302.1 ANTAR domain-containing protein [Allosaccharopolyspora coralli]